MKNKMFEDEAGLPRLVTVEELDELSRLALVVRSLQTLTIEEKDKFIAISNSVIYSLSKINQRLTSSESTED